MTNMTYSAETEARAAIVAEAKSWLRTPYHHGQAVKGAGVDCALFLAEVYFAAGVIPKIEFEYYPQDWHMHQNDERYLRHILNHAVKIEGPEGLDASSVLNPQSSVLPALPGDVAMYQFGRCTAHGAIVIEWPLLIHSYIDDGVTLVEAHSSKMEPNFRGIYRLKEWLVAGG